MNYCRETAKMGGPPGNRPAVPRDWFRTVPERYVAGADIRGRQASGPTPSPLPARRVGDYAPEGRAYSSERRTAIFVVAVTPGREFMEYPGYNSIIILFCCPLSEAICSIFS